MFSRAEDSVRVDVVVLSVRPQGICACHELQKERIGCFLIECCEGTNGVFFRMIYKEVS